MTTVDSIRAAFAEVSQLGVGLTPQVMLAKQLASQDTVASSESRLVLYYPLIYFGGEQPIEHQRVMVAREISALEQRDRRIILSCVVKFSSYLAGAGSFDEFLHSFTELAFLLQAKRGFIDKIPPYYELSRENTADLVAAFEPEQTRQKLSEAIRDILNERPAALEVVTPLSKMVTVMVECLLEEHHYPADANPFLYQPEGEGPAGLILREQSGVKGNMARFRLFDFWCFRRYSARYKLLSLLDNFIGVGGVSPNYFIGYPLLRWNDKTKPEKLGVVYFTGSEENVHPRTLDASLQGAFAFMEALDVEKALSHGNASKDCVCKGDEESWKRAVRQWFKRPNDREVSRYIDTLAGFRLKKAQRAICSTIRRTGSLEMDEAIALFKFQRLEEEEWFDQYIQPS